MSETFTIIDTTLKLKTPSLWKVIIHNDDFTPVEFVIVLLHNLFEKSIEEATKLTYMVHNNGKATAGLYTKEIALTKVSLVRRAADDFGHPLLATAEEAN